MFMKNRKTVRKSVGAKGMFGKIMSRFKTKPKNRVSKNITKPPVIAQKKIATKTKNGNNRKATSKTTIDQVRKIFVIKKENPNLSQENIGSIVGMSGVLVRYYSTMGKTKAISSFKKKDLKIKTKLKKAEKRANKKLKKSKSVTIFEGTAKIVGVKTVELTEKKAGENLDTLFKTEKYPTEHQADPRYFGGSEPRQSVATPEAFHKQKLKNNALRAISAKQIEKQKQDEATLIRIGARHRNPKTKPKIHYDDCPSCNPKSPLTYDQYRYKVTKESLRRYDYAQKKMAEKELQLNNKEKELDERERKQEPTVAEQAQQGTKLCRICDSRIAYSQATKSMNVFGEYYCSDHEPKLS